MDLLPRDSMQYMSGRRQLHGLLYDEAALQMLGPRYGYRPLYFIVRNWVTDR